MKTITIIRKTTACLQSHLRVKCALIGAVCGLGLLSNAFGQPIQLDLGNSALASNGAGFTKVGLNNASVVNGTYYEWDYVAGTAYTLSITNVNTWGGAGTLNSDGLYNISAAGPAYFTLSGLPAGNTVTIYACYAWDGSGKGGRFEYGGVTTSVVTGGAMTNPSISTLQFVGRTNVSASGTVSGRWYGQSGNQTNTEGQVGAMIFDVEPCQPAITMNGNNPILVPVNSTFTDPGATAVDSCSGSPLTVTTNGTVDATTIGTYTLTYTAISDGITNTATRTVNVVLSDFLNLDLGPSSTTVPTPAGFTKVLYTRGTTVSNMSVSVTSVGGRAYTLSFTNMASYNGGNSSSTLDKDGFMVAANKTAGFTLSNLVAGSQVTLYACWGWDGVAKSPTFKYAGSTTTLTVGSGITAPSITTLQNVGTAVADGTGVISGTWTNLLGNQGQIGGMIFGIQAPVGHSITILPSGVTNSCGGGATFNAAAPGGATYQWYNNLTNPITGATNTTLVLTGLHPSDSGNYTFTATATNSLWTSSTSAVVSIYDIAPPLMTMAGSQVIVVSLNSIWADPGITAYDTCPGNYLTVTTNGTVNTSVAGEYDLIYTATTGNGVSATNNRAVIVVDPTVVVADTNLDLDFGTTTEAWPAPDGFTKLSYGDLVNNVYGGTSFPDPTGIGSSLTLTFTNIVSWDTGVDTNYTISTDGFASSPARFGNLPAVFTLSGLAPGQAVAVYAVYGWHGLTDAPLFNYGGQSTLVTAGITMSSPNPPTQADFQYIGTAIATNGVVTGTWTGPGGATTEGDVGGMIFSIQSIPVHSAVVSPASITPQCGSNVTFTATASGGTPFTYRWYDNHTNLIVGATNATYTLVDPTPVSAGNYTVVVGNAFGSATNFATVPGTVDVAPPVMALNGQNPVNILVNSTYVDAGATAYDICAGASLTVSSNNPVDTATIGTYTVTYSATTSGGTPGSITRTVNVMAIPNLALNLDLAPSGNVPPAPAGFTLVQGGGSLSAVANYNYPDVAGSIYSLSISNVSMYNTGNTNEPLTTDGFYKSAANNFPATFTLSGLQPTLKVTLYAIYAWNGAGQAGNVFFGGTHAQIVNNGDPGTTPSLTNFTRIGATLVGSSGVVSGYWQGPISGTGTNTEGQVGGLVFLVGTNTPPVASPIAMSAIGGHPATLTIIGGAFAPTDADGDPLTITAVQSPTPNGGTVTINGTNVTYTSLNAFSGTDTFTYTVSDGYGGSSTATVTVTVTANSPPVTSPLVMGAVSGQPATLKIIGGASAPTDPNGDSPLTVTAVQSPTPNGGTVTTDGTNVTYTSLSAFAGTDTFTYTVGDGHGGFSTNTVTVSVVANAGFNILSGPTFNGGVFQVSYQGIPYASYVLLSTPSLTPPVTWTPVVTNTAGISGVITFSFTPSQSAGFYRTRSLQ
jgi:hypothetical protein